MDDKELKEIIKMYEYLTSHITQLPMFLQLQILCAFMDFNEKLKPIYVKASCFLGEKED